ncbi:hypothetical protein MTO96_039704 [Rhipicephalus appendiculatus]
MERSDSEINHDLFYIDYKDSEEWVQKSMWLALLPMEANQILIAQKGTSGHPPQQIFDVIHLGSNCILIGAGPKRNERQVCTLWVRTGFIGNFENDCLD